MKSNSDYEVNISSSDCTASAGSDSCLDSRTNSDSSSQFRKCRSSSGYNNSHNGDNNCSQSCFVADLHNALEEIITFRSCHTLFCIHSICTSSSCQKLS